MHFEAAAVQEVKEGEKKTSGSSRHSSDSEEELSVSLSDVFDALAPSKGPSVDLPKREESDSEELELAEKGLPSFSKSEEGEADRPVELEKEAELEKERSEPKDPPRKPNLREESHLETSAHAPVFSQPSLSPPAQGGEQRSTEQQQESTTRTSSIRERRFLPSSIMKRVSLSIDRSDTQTNASEPSSSFPASSFTNQDAVQGKRHLTLRDIIHITLEVPQSSKVATVWMIFIMSLIVLSTLTFILYSIPAYWLYSPSWIFVSEMVCVSVFSFEYTLRLITAPVWYRWIYPPTSRSGIHMLCIVMILLVVSEPINVVDLIAIVPFYIELGFRASGGGFMIVRVVRLLRLFRMFRIGLYSSTMKVVTRALRRSVDGFLILLVGILLALCLFSSAMFYAEQTVQVFDSSTQQWFRPDGSLSPYQSIPDTFWWCLATLTTVGYGDAVPISPAGKVVGALTMVTGLVVFAFPVTVFSSNFTNAWNEFQESKKRKKEHKKLRTMLTVYEDVPLHQLLIDLDKSQREIKEKIDQLTQAHAEVNTLVSELKIRSALSQADGKWFDDRRQAEV